MKTKLNLILSTIALSLITLLSCNKSDGDGPIIQDPGTYWPFQLNNAWSLHDAINNEDLDYKIYDTLSYSGQIYYSFVEPNQDDEVPVPLAVREDKGVFRMLYGPSSPENSEIGSGSLRYLSVNSAIDEVWADTLVLTIPNGDTTADFSIVHQGKVLEKLGSEVINDSTYKDLIKSELIQTINNAATGQSTVSKKLIWLAKDIGPVRIEFVEDDATKTYDLVSYEVRK